MQSIITDLAELAVDIEDGDITINEIINRIKFIKVRLTDR